MKNKFIYFAILAAMGITACEPEFENELNDSSYSAGDADFSSYVAIGNSLTAGVMDGTVSRGSQAYSFPSMLAGQFAIVGGGEFTQPSYAEDVNNLGGLAGIPGASTRLIINQAINPATGQPFGPQPIAGTSTITLTPQAMAFNNMGVPQAKTFHLLAPGYGNPAGLGTTANPYFVRMATSTSTTVMDDAMMKNPTFFTNWIGNNDVLGYSTSGGVGSTAGTGGGDITPLPVFTASYNAIIDRLTSNGAKGVVATIPNVTSIPYFTTVPYNPLTAAVIGGQAGEAAGVALIQAANAQLYGPISAALTAFGQPNRIHTLSTTEGNPLLIKDETLTNMAPQLTLALQAAGYTLPEATFIANIFGQARQATSSDLVLLTTRSVIGTAPTGIPAPFDKYGISYPLQDQHILTAAEIAEVNTATTAFNNVIRTAAQAKNLAVADMNAILNQLVSGLRTADGQIYTANYFAGTSNLSTVLFSLDGIHPNARGYAVITNEVIKVINQHYNAKLPFVSPGNFPGPTILTAN